jgi:hypothetical protein
VRYLSEAMMNKAQFIQHLIIRACPEADKTQSAIAHGEWLWDALTQAGYGDKKPAEPRELKHDAYTQLSPAQKASFDKFWVTFNYKVGKSRAALRWAQLGELSVAEYKKIIAAAKQEAQRDFKGQARKHAEGWLSERRWQDYEDLAAQPDNREFMRVNSELVGIKQLYASTKDPALEATIKKLEDRLRALRLLMYNNDDERKQAKNEGGYNAESR